MKRLFNPESIKRIITILAIMLVVKLVWFGVTMVFLTSSGVEYRKASRAEALPMTRGFTITKENQAQPNIIAQPPPTDISTLKLLALYRGADIIVITIAKGTQTKVMSKGDIMDGYRLDGATAREAIFTKEGKTYRIELEKTKESGTSSVNYHGNNKSINSTPKDANSSGEKIKKVDDVTTVDRGLFGHYRKNMDEIWKNIGIGEAKQDGEIIGFRVNFIKRDSDFAKLGLRRGDIILAVNGTRLDGIDKAMGIYQELDNIEELSLTVKRGEETMELEYAVN